MDKTLTRQPGDSSRLLAFLTIDICAVESIEFIQDFAQSVIAANLCSAIELIPQDAKLKSALTRLHSNIGKRVHHHVLPRHSLEHITGSRACLLTHYVTLSFETISHLSCPGRHHLDSAFEGKLPDRA